MEWKNTISKITILLDDLGNFLDSHNMQMTPPL